MSAEEHIPSYSIRPRFQVESAVRPDALVACIKARLETSKNQCQGVTAVKYALLTVPERERHFWSPHLTITIEEADHGSLVRGLYSPAPMAWTMFVFFYTVIGGLMLGVIFFGLSMYSLNKPLTIFWWLLPLGLLFLTIYLVAYFGQKAGRSQMGNLHSFIEACLGQNI
ncbi:MAG: hypothetical protein IT258_04930 [Saprospiraceae bacterium]|nr:hypothetical protein [Saprospiraceae bacterium]